MEFDPEDQDIIQLLTKLREAEAKYPEELMAARRQSYLKRMGEIGLGIGAERGMEEAAKDVKTSTVSSATSTLVETVLVIAIIAEALTVGYFYRDKLADLVRTITAEARVQGVTPPPAVPTSLGIQAITSSPALISTIPSAATLTISAEIPIITTGTPLPGVVDNNSIDNTGVNLLNATPAPNGINGSNTNNGNHYGQTPKPERTKENGNNPAPKEDKPPKENNDKPPKENNDKPPKDNSGQPPKDNNDKQPKTK